MRACRAVRVGLLTAFIAAAWLGQQVQGALAQTRPPVSSSEPAKVSAPKESPPRKEAGVAVSPYTAGLVTGPPQSTEFAIAQDVATTLASGQETGPRGEVALRVLPMVGNGGIRNMLDVLTLAGADIAIAPVVLVDRLRDTRTIADLQNKLVYITPLFVEGCESGLDSAASAQLESPASGCAAGISSMRRARAMLSARVPLASRP
jgi:hypothetical protein